MRAKDFLSEQKHVAEESLNEFAAFHGTFRPSLARFKPLSHFGTYKSAEERLHHLKTTNPKFADAENGYIYELDLGIQNPGVVRDYPEIRDPSPSSMKKIAAWSKDLLRDPRFSNYTGTNPINGNQNDNGKDILKHFATLAESGQWAESFPYTKFISLWINFLRDAGVDGLVYANKVENIRSKSFVTFNPDQIQIKGKPKKIILQNITEDIDSLSSQPKKVIGPFKLLNIDNDTVTVKGHPPLKLSGPVTDKLTPGFNYAFEVSDDKIVTVILMTVDTVIYTDDSILMIKRKNQPFAGHWALPGGFIDPGETPLEAAIRELQEETGLQIANAEPVGEFKTPHRDPRMENTWSYAFKLYIKDRATVKAGDDASAATWVPINKISTLPIAFDHIEIIKKALSNQVTEKWSAKYKRSINCNNPKGFSQRAHCQGRKKGNK